MISTPQLLLFGTTALVLAVTPGPNMIYLISRSLCQGKTAGVMSWLGVVLGLTMHMTCASIGLTALFLAVPLGYDILRLAGALYLLWLAWQTLRPGASSAFTAKSLAPAAPRQLFMMGWLTSLLNPSIAIFYLSVLPQFIQPESGPVLAQSLILGGLQVGIGSSVNLLVTLSAAGLSAWFAKHPFWLGVQRQLMGLTLGVLAARLFTQQRSAV